MKREISFRNLRIFKHSEFIHIKNLRKDVDFLSILKIVSIHIRKSENFSKKLQNYIEILKKKNNPEQMQFPFLPLFLISFSRRSDIAFFHIPSSLYRSGRRVHSREFNVFRNL